MLDENEAAVFEIISELSHKLKPTDLGLPLSVVYRTVKDKGIYRSMYTIREKIRKLESLGYIKIQSWNIVEVKGNV